MPLIKRWRLTISYKSSSAALAASAGPQKRVSGAGVVILSIAGGADA